LDARVELLPENFEFALGYEDGMSWDAYLDRLRKTRLGLQLEKGLVPATLLAAETRGEIVGRLSLRHRLNERLLHDGGHIGFAVRPKHRRRGNATAILGQGLVLARSFGIDRVLLTCEELNSASAAVIERCGGLLETVVTGHDGRRVRRYWIGPD
jgi:predicted acetyltransferase